MAAVVVVLGLVVPLVASGGDDDDDTANGGGGAGGAVPGQSGGGGSGSGDIDEFAATVTEALDQQDTDTLSGLTCPDASPSVAQAIEALDQTEGAELSSADQASSGQYLVAVDIYAEGSPMPFVLWVVDQGGGLCVEDVTGQTG